MICTVWSRFHINFKDTPKNIESITLESAILKIAKLEPFVKVFAAFISTNSNVNRYLKINYLKYFKVFEKGCHE